MDALRAALETITAGADPRWKEAVRSAWASDEYIRHGEIPLLDILRWSDLKARADAFGETLLGAMRVHLALLNEEGKRAHERLCAAYGAYRAEQAEIGRAWQEVYECYCSPQAAVGVAPGMPETGAAHYETVQKALGDFGQTVNDLRDTLSAPQMYALVSLVEGLERWMEKFRRMREALADPVGNAMVRKMRYKKKKKHPYALSAYIHVSKHAKASLSEREQQTLRLLGEGKSLKEIAVEMGVGYRTVLTFRRHLAEKLGLRKIGELVAYQVKNET